jgi:NAD/NADP transhydrogenase alpha subunit
LTPVQQRQREAMRALALSLDAALTRKQWAGAQRQLAQARLCALVRPMAREGDVDMAALHDRHYPQTWAELEQQLRERWQAQHQADVAHAETQAQRKAANRARQQKKASAPALAAELVHAEAAQKRLRSLFRQLASALHPDREPDPEQRALKTALMSEANAAHERRDWLALLDIQQRAALSTPASPANDAQLAEVTVLIKQQVADLERQRAALNDRWVAEFDLRSGTGVTAERLAAALSQQVQALQTHVEQIEAEAAQVQDPAAITRWLKAPSWLSPAER